MAQAQTLAMAVEVQAYDPARSNLLTYARDWTNAAYVKASASVVANAATSHDNQVLADKVVEAAANAVHSAGQLGAGLTIAVPAWLSLMVKAAGRTAFRLQTDGTAGTGAADFNLATGTWTGASGICTTAIIQAYGAGWYRCGLKVTPSASGTGGVRVILSAGVFGAAYLGDGVSGLYVDRSLAEVAADLGDFIDTDAVAGPGLRTLRWATEAFTTGAADVPPHVTFDGRLRRDVEFSRRAFQTARVIGGGGLSVGDVELANNDQALAYLLDLGLDGRAATVRLGVPGAAYPSGWTTWLTGTIEQVTVDRAVAILRLRDRQAILDLPLQAVKFAGTNALPAGAEGVAEDIKGQPKPLTWGKVLQVPAVRVNTARDIYQLHAGRIQAVDAVYDKGVPLTASGTDRASLAAMQAAAPAAGQYDTCLAEGFVRLGAPAVGRLTVDLRGEATGSYVDKVGGIVRRILEQQCGVATAEIDTAGFAALDAAAPYTVGLWIGVEATRRQAIDQLLASVGAWLMPTRLGVWTIGRLIAPAGAAALVLTDDNLQSLNRAPTRDAGRGLPVATVNLQYRRHWFVPGANDLGVVTEARRAELLQQWRSVSSADAATLVVHPLATTLEVASLITEAADAATEAARLLALHKVRRDFTTAAVPFTLQIAGRDIGDVVDVVTADLGYGAGRKFIAIAFSPSGALVEIDLWG